MWAHAFIRPAIVDGLPAMQHWAAHQLLPCYRAGQSMCHGPAISLCMDRPLEEDRGGSDARSPARMHTAPVVRALLRKCAAGPSTKYGEVRCSTTIFGERIYSCQRGALYTVTGQTHLSRKNTRRASPDKPRAARRSQFARKARDAAQRAFSTHSWPRSRLRR